jgi:ABC-type antimicrobial peptide transport system permease subunit
MHLVARSARPAPNPARELTNAIRATAPAVAVLEARTMNEQLLDLLGAQRSAASLLGLLSVIALVLSAGGIYAMVAFWVNERTREFSVRMALGATGQSIRTLALKQAARAVVIGMLIGIPLAWGLGLAARGLLFDLSPADSVSFSASVVVLQLVALAATLIPAKHAARTDPLKALRAGTE